MINMNAASEEKHRWLDIQGDPTLRLNPVRPPTITGSTLISGVVTLDWNSLAGHVYRVEYSDESPAGPWLTLGEDVVADASLTTSTDTTNLSPRRIYRVRLLN